MDDTDTSVTTEQVSDEGVVGQEVAQQPQPETTPAPSNLDPIDWLEKAEIDPSVKESLKAGFLRQADYTKKTQEIAALRRKAEMYDQLQQQQVKPQPQAPPQSEDEQLPDNPKDYAEYVTSKALEKMRAEWQQERELEMAARLDPRLDSDEEFQIEIARIVASDADFRSGRIGVVDATQKALAEHKARYDKLRQSVIEELNNKAKKTTQIPSGTGSPLSTAGKAKPTSMREAAKMAEEELSR